MAEFNGWVGKVLWIDLTSNKISKLPITDYEPEKYIGGVGLNARHFWDWGCPKVAAFDPANPLLISVGPLTGTRAPGATRAEICSIAPQCYPKELYSYSGFGGRWPAELKYAGYDGIVITGKADKPAYLSIYDDDVEIKDASDLWGLDTFETQKALTVNDLKTTTICIGPAGENLSRIAIILNQTGSAAGQGGFGAVMGSKKLKAIVVRGTGSVKIARPDEFSKLTRYARALSVDSGAANSHNNGDIAYMTGKRSADEMIHKYWKRGAGCYMCPWQCNGFYDVPGIGKGYATCGQFSYGLPGVRDPAEHGDYTTWLGEHKHTAPAISAKSMWEANILTQKLGINNFELWGLTGFLWKCSEESLFNMGDLGLPTPKWLGGTATEHDFLTTLLYGIANRSSLFTDGVARACELLGGKSMEIYESIYGARGFVAHWLDGIGGVLHWATDSRDPFNSCHDYNSVMGKPAVAGYAFGSEKVAYTDLHHPHKAIYVGTECGTVITQHRQRIKNSLTLCDFIFPILSSPVTDNNLGDTSLESKLYSAVTGVNIDEEGLYRVGERIFNLERAIMVKREGRTRKDDTVYDHKFKHKYWAEEPWHLGDHWCGPIDKTKFEVLKDAYYTMRGWDKKTGWPTRAKLEEIGLKDVADELVSKP